MSICNGNLAEYEKAKQLTVQEYLTKLEHVVRENKKKRSADDRL